MTAVRGHDPLSFRVDSSAPKSQLPQPQQQPGLSHTDPLQNPTANASSLSPTTQSAFSAPLPQTLPAAANENKQPLPSLDDVLREAANAGLSGDFLSREIQLAATRAK